MPPSRLAKVKKAESNKLLRIRAIGIFIYCQQVHELVQSFLEDNLEFSTEAEPIHSLNQQSTPRYTECMHSAPVTCVGLFISVLSVIIKNCKQAKYLLSTE